MRSRSANWYLTRSYRNQRDSKGNQFIYIYIQISIREQLRSQLLLHHPHHPPRLLHKEPSPTPNQHQPFVPFELLGERPHAFLLSTWNTRTQKCNHRNHEKCQKHSSSCTIGGVIRTTICVVTTWCTGCSQGMIVVQRIPPRVLQP